MIGIMINFVLKENKKSVTKTSYCTSNILTSKGTYIINYCLFCNDAVVGTKYLLSEENEMANQPL